jgi:general secretion pathway protein E/type IV pilus assembly protein PilB
VRTICPECKTEWSPADDELPIDFPKAQIQVDGKSRLFKGIGCRGCRNSGYRGRTGIHELLVNNDVLKDLIVQRVNAGVIRLEGLKGGMITLRQDGFRKATLGTTTLDEVGRTTAGDIS